MNLKRSICILLILFNTTLCACADTKEDIPEPTPPPVPEKENFDLIFADEFDHKRMNWDVWGEENPNNIKNNCSRSGETVEIKDGEMRLYIHQVNQERFKWKAAYIFLKQPLEHNTLIESRFKSGNATGVNNSFWLACKTKPNNSWCNKYEIDIVEARKDIRTGVGKAHIAWHDWKPYAYALDKNGNPCDIAAGKTVDFDFDNYHTWSLWYGENELIFYLDGKELWRGKSHDLYPEQYYTGVGKAPIWNPLEEQRAYGKYDQKDWSYQGGYNGDKMHVIFANCPWHASWSPLVDEQADGSYMAVDYIRIYKPKRLTNPTPDTLVKKPSQQITLEKHYSLMKDDCYYFSWNVTKKPSEELVMTLTDTNRSPVGKVIIDKDGNLLTGITRLTSSSVAASIIQGQQLVKDNIKTTVVCRITAKKSDKGLYDKDAISVWCMPEDEIKKSTEPYFYPNFDEHGNTSATQGWYINQKGYSNEVIQSVELSSTFDNLSSFGAFRAGTNFICVTR